MQLALLVKESPACWFEAAGMAGGCRVNLADFPATLMLFPNSVNMKWVKI
jgi:hypothetical protein